MGYTFYEVSELLGTKEMTAREFAEWIADIGKCGERKCAECVLNKMNTECSFNLCIPRNWKGNIDDARIYTYALSDAEIQDLAHQGINLMPHIDAGEDMTFQLQQHQLVLNATLYDDGKPAASDVNWSLVQAIPEGAKVTFVTESTRLDPTISFNMAGTYVMQVTADDGMAENSDTIMITVTSPTCADVIADGLTMPVDISGPDGGPDCKVDLYDLAEFARYWTRCNDPALPDCDFPY